jgi:hypothetical protein
MRQIRVSAAQQEQGTTAQEKWTSAPALHRKLIVAPHREQGTREAIACLIDGGEKCYTTHTHTHMVYTRNKAADLL